MENGSLMRKKNTNDGSSIKVELQWHDLTTRTAYWNIISMIHQFHQR